MAIHKATPIHLRLEKAVLTDWIVLTFDPDKAIDDLAEGVSTRFSGYDVHGPYSNLGEACEEGKRQREMGREADVFQAVRTVMRRDI